MYSTICVEWTEDHLMLVWYTSIHFPFQKALMRPSLGGGRIKRCTPPCLSVGPSVPCLRLTRNLSRRDRRCSVSRVQVVSDDKETGPGVADGIIWPFCRAAGEAVTPAAGDGPLVCLCSIANPSTRNRVLRSIQALYRRTAVWHSTGTWCWWHSS